jgi:hypothetical protein
MQEKTPRFRMRIGRTSEWDRTLPSGRGLERAAESFDFGATSAFGRVIGEANTKWNAQPAGIVAWREDQLHPGVRRRNGVRSRTAGSDFNLFSDDKRVINLDAEIADRTFHSRGRFWIWSFVRIDQAYLASSGGLAPTSFPLFQAMRFGGSRFEFSFCMVILLGCGGRP